MSKENPETERASPPARPRRSSFAEMFGGRPSFDASSGTGNGGANKPGSLSMAMAQQSRARRLSVTTLGLSGSPTRASQGGSAFDTLKDKGHRESSGASEQAIEDEDGVAPLNGEGGSRPTSPTIGRRLSLGARAYRDSMRASSGGSAPDSGGGSEALGTSPGGATGGMKGSTPPGREGQSHAPRAVSLFKADGHHGSDHGITNMHIRWLQLVREPPHTGTTIIDIRRCWYRCD